MGYQVKLSRIKNGSALRTDEVEGFTERLPTVGKSFGMLGVALDPNNGNMRVITTSPVKKVESLDHDAIQFETQNSIYRLDVLE